MASNKKCNNDGDWVKRAMSKKDKLHDSRLLQAYDPKNNTEKKDMLLQNIYSMETNLANAKKNQHNPYQKSLESLR